MGAHNWKENWLNAVREQIVWKTARPVLLRELEDHLEDQYEALRSCGETEAEAQQETLRQMGDPVFVGKALNQSHRPARNWLWMTVVMVIALVGAIAVSFGAVGDDYAGSSRQAHFLAQLFSLGLGAAMFFFLLFSNPMSLQKHAGKMAIGLILLMGMLFFISRRGTYTGSLGQYSGLLIPLGFSGALYQLRGKGAIGFGCGASALIVLLGVYVLSAGNWSYVLQGLLVSVVLFVMTVKHGAFGQKKWYLPAISAVFALLIVVCALHGWNRVSVLLYPENYAHTEGYMTLLLREMLQASRWIGQGLPVDRAIIGNYPSFSLALAIYRWGWLAGLALIAAEVALLSGGFVMAHRQKTLWGKLLAWSVVLSMLLESLVFLASNLGMAVSGSCHLPLLAYGGTFRVLDLTLLGLLTSLVRNGSVLRDRPETEKSLDFSGKIWYNSITKRE